MESEGRSKVCNYFREFTSIQLQKRLRFPATVLLMTQPGGVKNSRS